jgi:hypothetical protein
MPEIPNPQYLIPGPELVKMHVLNTVKEQPTRPLPDLR